MASENDKFKEWCILEILGHRRLAGEVTEAVIAGSAFLRIDIPGKDGKKVTQFYSPSSVYSIAPVTEEVAKSVAEHLEVEPVFRWELPAQLTTGNDR